MNEEKENLNAKDEDNKASVINEEKVSEKTVGPMGEVYDPLEISSKEQCIECIDKERKNCYLDNAKRRKFNLLLLGIFLAICVVGIIISLVQAQLIGLVFGSGLTFIVFLFINVKMSKRKSNEAVGRYLSSYYKYVDSYAYGDNFLIKEMKLSYNTRLNKDELVKNDIYENVTKTVARDYLVGKMIGVDFCTTDASYRTSLQNEKKEQTIAVGKLFKFNLKCKEKGKTFIYLSNKKTGRPTKIDGMKNLNVSSLNKEYEVLTTLDTAIHLFNENIVKALNEFESNDDLEDLIININDKHIYVFLSYSDHLMIPPYENEFDGKLLDQYRQDVTKIVSLIAAYVNLPLIERVKNK